MRTKAPILLVDDDKVDQLTVKRALLDSGINNPLLIASNGEEALTLLREQSQPPAMIFLDLNMPKMTGLEFLAQLRKDDQLSSIPVTILTTSSMERERREAYRLGVCGYMVKPVDFPDFLGMFKAINQYWTYSELPE